MKTTTFHLAATLLVLMILPYAAIAQSEDNTAKDNTAETTGPKRFWQADLPGGSYTVALDRITSISKHSYIIDGNISVTEVVIDTSGNALTRFYYLEPAGQGTANLGANISQRGKELLDKVSQRTGVNANSAVVKQYPETTHAKTVEFRISDGIALDALFNSARTAWINGRGKKFTIKTGNE